MESNQDGEERNASAIFSGQKWATWQNRMSSPFSSNGKRGKRTRTKLGSGFDTPSDSIAGRDTSPESSRSVPDRKYSFTFRAKQYLVAKSFSGSLGRSFVRNYLGKQGIPILDSLLAITQYHIGEKAALRFEKNIIRLIVQVKMVFDEGILTRMDAYRCEISIIGTTKIFLQFLEGKDEIDLKKMTLYLEDIRDQIQVLFRGLFSKKSVRKLDDLFSYFGGIDFIETVLYDVEVIEFRKELTSSLGETLDPFIRQNRDVLLEKFKHATLHLPSPQKNEDDSDDTQNRYGDSFSNTRSSRTTFTEFIANHERSVQSVDVENDFMNDVD